MPKRIAFIDLLFHYPPTGGSWVDLFEVASRLQKKGHEVCLFLPDFTKYYRRGVIKEDLPFEVRYINFSKFSFNRFSVPKRFLKSLDEYKPDYVFLGDGYFLKPHLAVAIAEKYPVILRFYAYEILCGLNNLRQPQLKKNCNNHILKNPFACWACLNWNLRTHKTGPKILLGRDTDNFRMHFGQEYLGALAFSPCYPSTVRKALKKAHKVIVYNDFIADILKPYSDNVQVTPSGIDINRYMYTSPPLSTKKRILFPGRVDDPVKGLPVVMDACRRLWQKRQDFELVITTAEEKLKTDPFIQLAGWLNQDELPALYQSCHLCLAPSTWREAFGITALEAMASGRPVIATNWGGFKQTIVEGQTGYLVPPNDSSTLFERINQLLDNNKLTVQMGINARERTEKEFSWDIIIDKYYQFIDNR
jgi:glycosyltransferase involved in cell wall biosynthesis